MGWTPPDGLDVGRAPTGGVAVREQADREARFS
jgi:hypothetical protein